MNNTQHGLYDSNLTVFLCGVIFNLVSGVTSSRVDSTINAFVGGIIWILCKVLADYISHRLIKNNTPNDKN